MRRFHTTRSALSSTRLGRNDTTSARLLEFTILTATRTGDSLYATWPEFDLSVPLWTVPAERTKAKREHRVPLSSAVVKLLKALPTFGGTGLVFEGIREGRPLSNMAMLKLLERMKRDDLTTHGFRSTFRDWAAECTAFPNEVAEMALAHAIRDKTESAYRRGDLLDKRREPDAGMGRLHRPAERCERHPFARRRRRAE